MVSDRFRLRYRLMSEDWKLFGRLAARRLKTKRNWFRLFVVLLVLQLVVVLLLSSPLSGYLSEPFRRGMVWGFASGVFAVLVVPLIARSMAEKGQPPQTDAMIGEFSLVAYEAGGLQIDGKHMQTSYDWAAFKDVTEGAKILVLWMGDRSGVIVPDRAFAEPQDRTAFADFVIERIAAHQKPGEHFGGD